MDLLRTTAEMTGWREQRWRAGHVVGFVPTMGYLHEGHLALMEEAMRRFEHAFCDVVGKTAHNGKGRSV